MLMSALHDRLLVVLLLAGLLLATLLVATDTRAETLGIAIVEPGAPETWGYSPAPMTVRAGDTLTWTNTGIAPHDVTAEGGAFASGILHSGESWTFSPTTPGSYSYFCSLHPWMRGVIEVVE